MRTLKKNWAKVAGAVTIAGLAFCALYACVSAWGDSAPGLSIALTSNNVVSLTVTNRASNGLYQIYFTEILSTNAADWVLLTNGVTGQSNFTAFMGDLEAGFFRAAYNTNFVAPSISVIIQSPLNGSVLQ